MARFDRDNFAEQPDPDRHAERWRTDFDDTIDRIDDKSANILFRWPEG